VLVTLELTEPAVERLAAAGLDEVLPQTELLPSRFTSGGGIHSRLPLTPRAPDRSRGFGDSPRATIEVPDAGPVLVDAVHPLPPIVPDWTLQWRDALAALPAAQPDVERRILAGDFNATLDHAPLRDVLGRGWVDAADAVGAGLVPTFNALPFGEPVPPVTIDHVLVDRRTAVQDVRTVALPGSDHRMLVADLRLPAG
jgi:endonuclease/exonuclease/phosphatase family metal-dependent hydrolase